MGGIIGIGTIYSAFTTGVMIAFFKQCLDQYIFMGKEVK